MVKSFSQNEFNINVLDQMGRNMIHRAVLNEVTFTMQVLFIYFYFLFNSHINISFK